MRWQAVKAESEENIRITNPNSLVTTLLAVQVQGIGVGTDGRTAKVIVDIVV